MEILQAPLLIRLRMDSSVQKALQKAAADRRVHGENFPAELLPLAVERADRVGNIFVFVVRPGGINFSGSGHQVFQRQILPVSQKTGHSHGRQQNRRRVNQDHIPHVLYPRREVPVVQADHRGKAGLFAFRPQERVGGAVDLPGRHLSRQVQRAAPVTVARNEIPALISHIDERLVRQIAAAEKFKKLLRVQHIHHGALGGAAGRGRGRHDQMERVMAFLPLRHVEIPVGNRVRKEEETFPVFEDSLQPALRIVAVDRIERAVDLPAVFGNHAVGQENAVFTRKDIRVHHKIVRNDGTAHKRRSLRQQGVVAHLHFAVDMDQPGDAGVVHHQVGKIDQLFQCSVHLRETRFKVAVHGLDLVFPNRFQRHKINGNQQGRNNGRDQQIPA